MKRKHYGFLALVLTIACVAGVAVYAFKGFEKMAGKRRTLKFRPPPVTVSVPGGDELREMRKLEHKLPVVAHPPGLEISAVNLSLFGYQPVKERTYRGAGKKIVLPPQMRYSVSLAFSAKTRRFCVIDGNFYQEGAALPGGGKIVKIEPRRVLIRKDRLKCWVPVGKAARDTGGAVGSKE